MPPDSIDLGHYPGNADKRAPQGTQTNEPRPQWCLDRATTATAVSSPGVRGVQRLASPEVRTEIANLDTRLSTRIAELRAKIAGVRTVFTGSRAENRPSVGCAFAAKSAGTVCSLLPDSGDHGVLQQPLSGIFDDGLEPAHLVVLPTPQSTVSIVAKMPSIQGVYGNRDSMSVLATRRPQPEKRKPSLSPRRLLWSGSEFQNQALPRNTR